MSSPYLSGTVPSYVFSSINHAHTTVVFSTSDHISTLLKLAPKVPCLRLVVVIDSIPSQSAKLFAEWGQSVGIKVQEWDERASILSINVIAEM